MQRRSGVERDPLLREVASEPGPRRNGADPASPPPPRFRRRYLLVAVGLFVAVFVAGSLLSAMSVRRELQASEAALRRGRTELGDGEARAARSSFERARTGFVRASDGVDGPWLRVLGWIPWAGRTTDAVTAVAAAGIEVADAGRTLADAIDGLPDGLASLAPSNGRIPLERFVPLSAAVEQAADATARALVSVEAAPTGMLLGPVSDARDAAEEEIRSLHETLEAGATVLKGLPTFLGGDGPRRYFFGAQNPAELRGTGGVIGAYAILTIDDGAFEFSAFNPIQSLPEPDLDEVPPPTPEYSANYDAFRGDGRFWLAINLTPDFPTAAKAILGAYEAATGDRLDGVILSDPFALQALLRITGPAYVPRLDRMVGAADVVAFTANEAYALYDDPATRKRVLGAVAEGVFQEFVTSRGTDLADLRSLARAAAEGHILAYSEDAALQEGLVGTGAGGGLTGDPGDFLAVVENSSGGTKVDYYESREVRYDVQLWDGGAGEATASVGLTNDAPSTGLPRYVIGPNPGFAAAGEGGQLLALYCGGCQLEHAERDGTTLGLGTGSELGYTFYRDYFRTASGASSRLEATWYLPNAWEGSRTGGSYRLTFLNQTTILPTTLTVRIQAPDGMRFVGASPDVVLDGGVATWEGEPGRRLELRLEFEPPLAVRIWRALTG